MGKKIKKLKSNAFSRIYVKNASGAVQDTAKENTAALESSATACHTLPGHTTLHGSIAAKKTASKYSASQLLEKAEEYLDTFDFALAEKFCRRAIELEPDNITALEMLGFLLLQSDKLDDARKFYCRAIELDPSNGHSKYLYMGQLSTGLDAVQFYNRGIDVMRKAIAVTSKAKEDEALAVAAGGSEKSSAPVTERDISCAYCAIAEIYLTDICYEDDAETKCLENIQCALQSDASNPEAYQLLASFRLCKEEKQLASETIEKGLALWLPQLRKVHTVSGSDDDCSDPIQVCPVSYPMRISYTKILIELENYETAEEILGFLFQENSQVVDVWYLFGWMNYLKGTDFYGNARYYLTKGHELAMKINCEDEQMVSHITELLSEIGRATDSDLEDEGEEVLSQSEDDDDDVKDGRQDGVRQEENMCH